MAAFDFSPAHAGKYHISLRVLHWIMAVIILGMIASGFIMTGLADSDDKWKVYGLHKSFGMVVLGLIAIRVMARTFTTLPPYPDALSAFLQRLARFTHKLLYVLMIVAPLSGYLMSLYGGYPVAIFGIATPSWIAKNEAYAKIIKEIHEISPYVLLAFIGLHLAAALKHRYMDRINIFSRIW